MTWLGKGWMMPAGPETRSGGVIEKIIGKTVMEEGFWRPREFPSVGLTETHVEHIVLTPFPLFIAAHPGQTPPSPHVLKPNPVITSTTASVHYRTLCFSFPNKSSLLCPNSPRTSTGWKPSDGGCYYLPPACTYRSSGPSASPHGYGKKAV